MHYLFTRKLWAHRFRMIGKQVKKMILPGNDPDFIIIGAQKAGTTSLAFYLDQHPLINQAIRKEVHFFDFDKQYQKGLAWYKKNFLATIWRAGRQFYFEATPDYIYEAKALERIHQNYPKIKMILVLRDPVARAFSAWNMRMYRYKIKMTDKSIPEFDVCINDEISNFRKNGVLPEGGFVKRGLYAEQLRKFYSLFGKEQLLILGAKDLSQKPTETLNAVLKFVGMPDSSWKFLNDKKQNVFGYQKKIDADSRALLQEFYEKYNQELFDLIGYKPNW